MNYNLLNEDWIPVLYQNGRWKRIGILKALTEANEIRQIAASNPMDNFAVLRFLIAIVYWSNGNPPEDRASIPEESIIEHCCKKLEEKRDCFNLLGDGKRFYQDISYRNISPNSTTHYFAQEIPTGNNFWHFKHLTDTGDGLCPACCATGLLRLQVFATQGGKGMHKDSGKSPGINSKPPVYSLLRGDTLADGVLKNWTSLFQAIGKPEWEIPGQVLPSNGEVPLLLGLTWIPRRVWLKEPGQQQLTCAQCGDLDYLIKDCVWDGKGSLKNVGYIWHDPHTTFNKEKENDKSPIMLSDAVKYQNSRESQWLNFLHHHIIENRSRTVLYGIATKQDQLVEAHEFVLNVDKESVEKDLLISRMKNWQKADSYISRAVRPKDSPKKKKHEEIKYAIASIRPHIEHTVSARIDELLSGGEEAWQKAAKEYRPMMDIISKSLSPGFTTKAVKRRQQIADTIPDMSIKEEKEEKTKPKKGGNKWEQQQNTLDI